MDEMQPDKHINGKKGEGGGWSIRRYLSKWYYRSLLALVHFRSLSL